MSLIDEYRDRIKKKGTNKKEQYINISKAYYENYLIKSGNREKIIWKGKHMPVVLITNNQDDAKLTRYMFTPRNVGIKVGDFFKWVSQVEEPATDWIVLRRIDYSFQGYDKFVVIRANFNIKWIDSFGKVNEAAVFAKGSMESNVAGGWKFAENLSIPVPNKGLLMISPVISLLNNQRVLLDKEGWRILERDKISNPGIVYFSLIEDKTDAFNDDLENDLADIYKKEKYIIDVGFSTGQLEINETLVIEPVLYVNGKKEPADFFLKPGYPSFTSVSSYEITGLYEGSEEFTVSLKDNPNVSTTFTLDIVSSKTEENIEYKIVGDKSIKWGRERVYTLIKVENGNKEEIAGTFSIDGDLAVLKEETSSSCRIKAKAEKIGSFVLTAVHENGQVEKTIQVDSLWGD